MPCQDIVREITLGEAHAYTCGEGQGPDRLLDAREGRGRNNRRGQRIVHVDDVQVEQIRLWGRPNIATLRGAVPVCEVEDPQYLYIGGERLTVVDAHDPLTPRVLGNLGPPSEVNAIIALDEYLFTTGAGWQEGLVVLPAPCNPAHAIDDGSLLGLRDGLRLGAPYPQPSAAGITIPLDLPADATARANVYDAGGRLVRAIATASLGQGGRQDIAWDGRDDDGHRAPAGVYLVRVRAMGIEATCTVVLAH
ncbi:MAG: FlgD immunoglobulin-like domain containing protein [Candidatus Eisenbacteria bacterium]